MICQHCGKDETLHYNERIKAQLIAKTRCHECNFWMELSERSPDGLSVITNEWYHSRIGEGTSRIATHRGNYGRTYTVTWFDTTRFPTVTNDLWNQGIIPVRHRNRFTPNARFTEGTEIHIKEYTVTIRVATEDPDEFPSIDNLVNGMNDGLPDDWMSATEGDDYWIDAWVFGETNNPRYVGTRAKP